MRPPRVPVTSRAAGQSPGGSWWRAAAACPSFQAHRPLCPAQHSRQPLLGDTACAFLGSTSAAHSVSGLLWKYFWLLHAPNNCLSPPPSTAYTHFYSCPILLANFPQASLGRAGFHVMQHGTRSLPPPGDLSLSPAPPTSGGGGIWAAMPLMEQLSPQPGREARTHGSPLSFFPAHLCSTRSPRFSSRSFAPKGLILAQDLRWPRLGFAMWRKHGMGVPLDHTAAGKLKRARARTQLLAT